MHIIYYMSTAISRLKGFFIFNDDDIAIFIQFNINRYVVFFLYSYLQYFKIFFAFIKKKVINYIINIYFERVSIYMY